MGVHLENVTPLTVTCCCLSYVCGLIMKFRVHMKDPEVLSNGVSEAVNREIDKRQMSEEAGNQLAKRTFALANKFFQHGEYVTLEFDTETGTGIVVNLDDDVPADALDGLGRCFDRGG